jgi:hypothetical protein
MRLHTLCSSTTTLNYRLLELFFSSILFVNDIIINLIHINTKSQQKLKLPQSTTTQSFQPTTPARKNNRKIKIINKKSFKLETGFELIKFNL